MRQNGRTHRHEAFTAIHAGHNSDTLRKMYMEENQVIEDATDTPKVESAEERMIPQSQVNKIIKHKTYEAAQVQRELEERHQKELAEIRAQQTQRNENVPRDMDANAIYQQVQEKFNQEMQQRHLQSKIDEVATSYLSKIEQGKANYHDFDEVTQKFDPTKFPQLVYLLAGMDGAPDILYDLMQRNPEKLAEIQSLAERAPELAQDRLLRLSKSIMDNRQAQSDENSQQVAEPLDRLQSSRVSGSNGKMGIRDLRKQPWLRG